MWRQASLGCPETGSMFSVLQPSAALFEACCNDRIQPFDDEEEEDIWEDEETRCTARVMARARCEVQPSSQSLY
jgi:hypothetical protein